MENGVNDTNGKAIVGVFSSSPGLVGRSTNESAAILYLMVIGGFEKLIANILRVCTADYELKIKILLRGLF